MANGGTELAKNKANNCPPLAGDQGGGKKRGYHAKKQKPMMPTITPLTNTAVLPAACRRKCVVLS
ncbi:MAG: hypothetical protein B6D34_11655 [Candidatus Brocadia sp. UTAMX1]|jgi:hypothetical protein|nr:MAG: hypothetical protein B6D34_11655 [Candidatus Brocadia sp. UTAMX1]